MVTRNVSLTMSRGSLANIPFHPAPTGYSIRPYLPGDEQTWILIESAADRCNRITLDLFRSEFGDDPAPLERRLCFLLDSDGQAIGTAAAWFDGNHHGQPFGRVHWVAIHPDSQGLGLSKPLLSRVCSTLRELGHDRAYLITSTARIPAIMLYLGFGFAPEINGPEDATAWAEIEKHISRLAPRNGKVY